MYAVGLGAERQVMDRIESMGSNLIIVTAGRTRVVGGMIRRSSLSKTLKPADSRAIVKACPSVELAAGSMKRSIIVHYRGVRVKTGLVGLEPDGFSIRNIPIEKGRPYTPSDERAKRRVAVFAPTAAKNCFDDENPIGKTVRLANQPFRIIGLTGIKGANLEGADQDDTVYIPLSVAMRRLVNVNYIEEIYVKAREGVHLSRAEDEIKVVLRKQHRLGKREDDFSVYNQLDLIRLQRGMARSLTLAIVSVSALAWIIGGVGILAVMLMSVRERRSEIGLRRALGARKKDIGYQFLFEACLLAALGGLSGLLFGFAGAWFTDAMGWAPVRVSWLTAFTALGLSIFLGLISGIYPAIRAARLAPVEALG
jgi:putative ABC transport system permease protein